MRLPAILGVALRRLRQRPVRTFLLLQGTVWGVAVAIAPSAVIAGTREAARTQGATLGADRITVAADPTSARATGLTRFDMDVIRGALDDAGIGIKAMGGVRVHSSPPSALSDGSTLTVLSSTSDAEPARGLKLAAGRWLRPGDSVRGSCVVEAGVAASLGLERLEPGQRLRLPSRGPPALTTNPDEGFEIVGIAAPRSAQVLRTNDIGFDIEHEMYKKVGAQLLLAMGIPIVKDDWKRSERCIYVPWRRGGLQDRVDWIFARIETTQISGAADVIRNTMASQDQAVVTLYPLVLPVVLGEQVDRYAAINLAMFLACLLMGAVVMMNFGLLNALTRAREIAIRRVEGATQRDITLQFLFEGLFLAALGSGFGCLLGMGLAQLRTSLEPVTGFTWVFPWREAAWAVSIALLVGLAAAAVPARKAALQDPVRGLVDE